MHSLLVFFGNMLEPIEKDIEKLYEKKVCYSIL